MRILHLTHTDIRFDNRIIKEISALSSVPDYQLFGIGIIRDEGAAIHNTSDLNAKIINLNLFFSRATFLPKVIKHVFVFLELLIKSIYYAIKIRPSVVHCHDTLVLPIGIIARLFTRARVIYDAHELESNKNGQSKIYSVGTYILEYVCYPFVYLLISVSPSIIDWYNEKLGPKKSLLILNSPHINNEFKINDGIKTDGKYFHNKYNISQESLVFIYLGALAPGRGIELLLEAFEGGKIKSHIVFMGFGILKDSIVEKSNICENIHYHESVAHDEVVALVKHASVGLCVLQNISLSDYYCLPNKLFEYVFSGIPVLATNFPDISKIIDEYKLGKYCNFNLNEVIASINELELYPPQKITTDLSSLSWEAQAAKLINAYKEL